MQVTNSEEVPPVYRQVVIYYFSGTGNARSVARWMAETAREAGLETTVTDLSAMRGKAALPGNPDVLTGFCSPTHGFNFPPVTLKFLLKFPRGRGDVFIMNTRAGVRLWKLHLCGLSGMAQYLAALILIGKGYRIVGMRPVDLPSNWISLHPGLREKAVRPIFTRCETHVRKFAAKLIHGGRGYRALADIVQDLLVAPVALAYYVIGRFILAKTFYANRDCTMCGICIRSCPVGAIVESGGRPYWTFRCESCMKCMNHCPERAIQTAHGFVILLFVLLFNVVMEWLWFFTVDRLPDSQVAAFFNHGTIKFLVASALCIPFIWLGYKLIHYLLRFRAAERMLTWSSLTALRFWRRYRAPVR